MIYFTLDDFCNRMVANNRFVDYLRNNRYQFIFNDLYFTGADGSFPFNYWNGDKNNCTGKLLLQPDFYEISNKGALPLRLDFSNIHIKPEDFQDCMSNAILQNCQNNSGFVIITNFQLVDYIEQNFKGYKYILSKNADIIFNYTADMINKIIATDKFELIQVPARFNSDIEFLNSITNRKKLEITITPRCTCSYEQIKECINQENTYQYNYSNKSIFKNCQKSKGVVIPSEDIINKYTPLGINHFKIDSNDMSENAYIMFLIDYFIKPEYKVFAMQQLLR